jgi:PAS domain S-box-containing protein
MTMAVTADAATPADAPSRAEPDPRPAGDLERLTRLAARVLKAPVAIVTTLRPREGERVLVGAGMREPLVPGYPLPLERLTGRRRGPGTVVSVRDANRSHLPGAAALADAGVVACLVCPLLDSRGRARGMLAVLDRVPRRWPREDRGVLGELAVLAGRELERLDTVQVAEALARARAALSGAEQVPGLVHPPPVGLFTAEGGRITWTNAELAQIAGYTTEEMTAIEIPQILLGDEDREPLIRELEGPAPLADPVLLCTELRRRDASVGRVEVSLGRVELGDRFVLVGAVRSLDEADDDVEVLRAEATRYRSTFEDDLCGVVIAGPDRRILACNAEFARIMGLPSTGFAVGQELTRLEPEPGQLAAWVERLDGRPSGPEELELVRRDGTAAYVVARLEAITGPGGEVREYHGYLVDVTQRALRERALRQSDERLRLLELATNDVTWEWDLLTGRTAWNGAGPRRFRYAPQEVRPTLEWQVERIHGEDRERVMAGLQQAVAGIGDSWADEYRFLRGDGTYATVHNRAYLVRNVRGEPVRVIGWMVDVTERKRTEESQRFLARASALLDSTLDVGVTATNLARVCVPAMADFCVLDVVEESGEVRRTAVAHARSARERMLNPGSCIPAGTYDPGHPILAVVESGEPALCTECDAAALAALDRALGGEGSARRLGVHSYMVVPIRAYERLVAVMLLGLSRTGRRYDPMDLIVAKDLALRAALALENARLYETAQHALRARQEVLGVVSHDLRGPLSTLVTTAVLLSETSRERREETRKWLDVIRRAADQMNQLIGDLLDVSQIEAGRFAVELAPRSLQALLAQTCEQWGAQAQAGGLRLECDVEPDLPPVECDVRQLSRVLANLLGNALKFTPQGGVVSLHAAAAGTEVRVSVADTGPGLAPDQIDRVFDRFWKARDVDRRGAGLGLAIARGIVEAHHGRIGVDSVEGQGSTFWFALPVRGSVPEGAPAQPPAFAPPGPPPSLPSLPLVRRAALNDVPAR